MKLRELIDEEQILKEEGKKLIDQIGTFNPSPEIKKLLKILIYIKVIVFQILLVKIY